MFKIIDVTFHSCTCSASYPPHILSTSTLQVVVLTNWFESIDIISVCVTRQGTALALPTPNALVIHGPNQLPSVPVDCRSYIGDKRTSMSLYCSGLSQYYGGVHAPNETSASHCCFRNLTGLHDSLPVPASAYSPCFCSATDKTDQPGYRRNRHSRTAHRKRSRRPSILDETRRKDGLANLDSQVSPTDSKAAESDSRIGRAFSIGLLICQLRAIIHFSTRGTVSVAQKYWHSRTACTHKRHTIGFGPHRIFCSWHSARRHHPLGCCRRRQPDFLGKWKCRWARNAKIIFRNFWGSTTGNTTLNPNTFRRSRHWQSSHWNEPSQSIFYGSTRRDQPCDPDPDYQQYRSRHLELECQQ